MMNDSEVTMWVRLTAIIAIVGLVACGTPSSVTEQDSSAPQGLEPIQDEITFETIEYEVPPPLVDGNFRPLTSDPINLVLFPEQDSFDIRVIGMIESQGLLYIYFSDGRSVYYAVSGDGVEWALSPDPVFTGLISDDFEYHPYSVGFTDQGYAIFLSSATINYADHNYLYSVWGLSAPHPSGPWQLSSGPLLRGYPGDNGIALYITDPIVRPYSDGYRMYHRLSFSIEGIGTPDFGVAHSMDGSLWRYTSDLPREEMPDEPVLIARAVEDDLNGLHILDIWPTESGWQMLFTIPENEGTEPSLHLGEAVDGLQWDTSPIAFNLHQTDSEQVIVTASAIFHNGSYYLAYCSAKAGGNQSTCYIAENEE